MDKFKNVIRVVIPIVIIALAVVISRKIIENKPKAKKKRGAGVSRAPLVQVTKLKKRSMEVDVRAQGTVTPSKQVVIQPEVSGRLYGLNESLVVGGILAKNEILARVNRVDYQLNVKERQNAIDEAKTRLKIEQGQQVIAQKEWALFNKGKSPASSVDPSLALRQPQLKSSKLAIAAAELRLKRAQIDLGRTTVRTPFNAMVRSEDAEQGQIVGPQSRLATLVGTDIFWVRASVPLKYLPDLKIPGYNAKEGSEVTVVQEFGDQSVRRTGKVIRLLGELDAVGSMAQMIIAIDDPLNLKDEHKKLAIPLLLGSYVQVIFQAGQKNDLIEIPRESLHDGNTVFIHENGKLKIKKVNIVWRKPNSVLVDKGVVEGESLVISLIAAPVEGMAIRIEGDPASKKPPAKSSPKPGAKKGGKP